MIRTLNVLMLGLVLGSIPFVLADLLRHPLPPPRPDVAPAWYRDIEPLPAPGTMAEAHTNRD